MEGNISLQWEHRFSDVFTVEAGMGVLLTDTILEMPSVMSSKRNPAFVQNNPGFSFSLSPRFYYSNTFPHLYNSLLYSYKNYGHSQLHAISIVTGYVWTVSEKFIIDFASGISFIKQHGKNGYPLLFNKEKNDLLFDIYMSVKLGYII
ncbi:hypothetical protein M2132_001550 [Dysgonomonas sp. PH5-45]|uniref:hypothetical protein n=1 Tax=unclassified Dysgonomonas TaxID=2630389 RepID=UPI00247462B4|nr:MULTISPECIES: hypothetical protein [unclassified Dysgonomonas]MDH6355213.1 hypothetical protein [Dysgonomonas sp. PH5-45]MDH6388061.1 hypothetical protein [Dysgonomonas sp. PH5-37]